MRILIADDDEVSRCKLEALLSKWGYEVISVEDGMTAWEALQHEDAPRLTILDWMMPGMDGSEICRQLRHSSKGAYVWADEKGRRITSRLLPVFVAPFRRWQRPPFSVRTELVRCVPCTNR
jgi:CheY-like chemotaxis protein